MIQFSDEEYAVLLSDQAIAVIKREMGKAGRFETGGILIGKYSSSLQRAEVIEATGPGKRSILRRFSFKRGVSGLQAQLVKANIVGKYYLGEWHSHPHAKPDPSSQDLIQMRNISMDPAYSCPEPILLIAGGQAAEPKISIHIVTKENTVLLKEKIDA